MMKSLNEVSRFNENKMWSNLDMLMLRMFVEAKRKSKFMDKAIFSKASDFFGRSENACAIRFYNIENGTIPIDLSDPAIKEFFASKPLHNKELTPTYTSFRSAQRAIEAEYDYMLYQNRNQRQTISEHVQEIRELKAQLERADILHTESSHSEMNHSEKLQSAYAERDNVIKKLEKALLEGKEWQELAEMFEEEKKILRDELNRIVEHNVTLVKAQQLWKTYSGEGT
jgi:hypothetical protein